METDWQDRGPDACRARREIFNACNGRAFKFDGKAFITQDTTDYMLRGGQGIHPDYCKTTDSIVPTEVDAGFDDLRDLLTEHLRIVSGAGYTGPHQHRWLKAAADC